MASDLATSWLGALEAVDVRVDARLRPGRHAVDALPGVPALRLQVPARASARFDACIRRDGAGYVLQRASGTFVPALRIINPKSTLQPGHPLIDVIGDLVAALEIASLRVGRDGRIEPRLVRRLFGLFRSLQALSPTDQARLQLPAPLYTLPALVAPARVPAKPSPAAAPASGGRSTAAQLDVAARLLDELRVTVTAMTEALPLPTLVSVAPLSPGRVTLHLDAEVTTDPVEPGLRVRVARPAAPQLECDLLRVLLSVDGLVRSLGDAIIGDGRIEAAVELREESIVLTPQVGTRVPITLQQGARIDVAGDWTLGPAGPALSGARVRTSLRARPLSPEPLQLGGATLAFADAQVDVRGPSDLAVAPGQPRIDLTSDDLVASVRLRDPELYVGPTPLVVAGTIEANLRVRELSMSGASGRLAGHLDLLVDMPQLPDDARIATKGFPVDVEVFADGMVRAQPLTGVLDMFEPWVDLDGDVTKVRDPLAPAAGAKGSAEVRGAIEARTGAASRSGNRVELLVDGIESYPKRLALIESAKRSLCVQTLIFADDDSGTEVADRLAAKARAGVKVRVIIDALGNIDPLDPLRTVGGRKVYDVMRRAGVDLRLYNGLAAETLLALLGEAGGNLAGSLAGGAAIDLRDPVALVGLLGRVLQQAKGAGPSEIDARLSQLLAAGDRLMRRTRARPIGPTKSRGPAVLDTDDVLLLVRYLATLNHRWHEKYMIADDHALIMGGLNIADEYSYGGKPGVTVAGDRPAWRDTDVYIEGPAVLDALQSFADNWHAVDGEPITVPDPAQAVPAGDAIVQMLQHRPREDGDHHIQNALLEHLASLGPGDRALFANAYMLPMGGLAPLLAGLEAAARRGVDVRIVTNSVTTTDAPQVNYAAVFAERQMLAAGIRCFERTGRRTMHSKFAVLGDDVVAIGSWNMDNRSESLNSEALALVHDRALADRAARTIEADMAPDVAKELRPDDPVMRGQPVRDELRSLGLCACGELL